MAIAGLFTLGILEICLAAERTTDPVLPADTRASAFPFDTREAATRTEAFGLFTTAFFGDSSIDMESGV